MGVDFIGYFVVFCVLMNAGLPFNMENFFTPWATVCFSWRTMFSWREFTKARPSDSDLLIIPILEANLNVTEFIKVLIRKLRSSCESHLLVQYLNILLSEDEKTDSVSAKKLSVLTLNIISLSAQVKIIKEGSNILPYDTIVC
jgi:hypothetical protein